MAKAKSTSAMGQEHEEAVVKAFSFDNARRSASSGASFHDPIDVSTDHLVIECEATEKKSYTLKLDFWNEIVSKQHSGKIPCLSIRFRDPENGRHVDLLITEIYDAADWVENGS